MVRSEKQSYLAVSDYGQGGVWVVIDARSEEETAAAYPELKVVHDRPSWLSESEMNLIREQFHFDIDAPLSGWLAVLVGGRTGRGLTSA
jgi:hypothetical protein